VLNYGRPVTSPDASVTLTKATLDAIQLNETTVEAAVAKGDLTFGGRREAFGEFMGLLDTFPLWFNIVTR
jgi:linear primary-alkylsulfatase